jgi:hypothetical protein
MVLLKYVIHQFCVDRSNEYTFLQMLIDWLIDYWLIDVGEKYFVHIKNEFNNNHTENKGEIG